MKIKILALMIGFTGLVSVHAAVEDEIIKKYLKLDIESSV